MLLLTKDLKNAHLDYFVAKAIGEPKSHLEEFAIRHSHDLSNYSIDPALMWPIIEEHDIMLDRGPDTKIAIIKRRTNVMDKFDTFCAEGSNWLVAAARCYVMSVYGGEVQMSTDLYVELGLPLQNNT